MPPTQILLSYELHQPPSDREHGKKVKIRYDNGRKPSPNYACLRHFYMSLINPETGKPLIEGINLNPNKPGTLQIMSVNAGNNSKFLDRIKEHPAAWWWQYLLSMSIKTTCTQILMDSFDFGPRMNAQHSSFDSSTWIVTSSKDPPPKNFCKQDG